MGRKRNIKKMISTPSNQPENLDIVTCKTSDLYGRYLEANQNIQKGALILSETCLIAGPLRSSDPVCLGCHSSIDIANSKACCRCSWPLCSDKCAESSFHKSECLFFSDQKIQVPTNKQFDFGVITVLRGLLLKLNDPTGWQKLIGLEHHNELRKVLPLWEQNRQDVVSVICEDWKLETLFSTEEVHTVCGILEVNAFEMGQTYSFRGIFPKAAMLAHNCIPNSTQFENSDEGIIEIRAAGNISAGSPIFFSYAFFLQPTPLRRKMLMETKFFNCCCQRCCDPTECESHMNTLICPLCKTGFVLIEKNLKEIEFGACNKCQNRMAMEEIEAIQLYFGTRSQNFTDIQSQESFLLECTTVFHPQHFIPFGVKFNLCQAYGRQDVDLLNLADNELERKSTICSEVLQVLDIVYPGYNVTRGLVLYEQQAADVMIARGIFERGKFNKSILRRKLENALEMLTESITILQLAHASTDEHKMAKAAQEDSVVGLNRWISSLK